MIIIGIDPGSVRVGFGVIKKDGGQLNHLESGLLEISSKNDDYKNLATLESCFIKLLERLKPQIIGIEKLFFVKNQKTAVRVAQTRGVIINAIIKKSIPLLEISPSEVKLAVAGDGSASKSAVAKMVNYFLNLPQSRSPDDVTDALAIAIAISNKTRGIDI